MYNDNDGDEEMKQGKLPGSPHGAPGKSSSGAKAQGVSPKQDLNSGFGNYHGNLMNSGKDDSAQQKASRLAAIKRRMAKAY